MKIIVEFNAGWLYAASHMFVASKFESLCEEKFGNDLLSFNRSFSVCSLEFDSHIDTDAAINTIKELLEKLTAPDRIETVCKIKVDGQSENKIAIPSTPKERESSNSGVVSFVEHEEPQTPNSSTLTSKGELSDPEDMIGNQAFKNLCREIKARAVRIIKNQTFEFFFSTAYLFSVNTGNGFKTSIKMLDTLLRDCGLFKNPSEPENFVLPVPSSEECGQKIINIIGSLKNYLSVPRIITIDISSWLGHTGQSEFKNLLMSIFRHNTQCLIIFRIPYIKETLLNEALADISDVISIHPVVFEPFTQEELRQLAKGMIAPYGFSFTEEAMQEFDQRIEDEKSDGYFYGVHTVKKIIGSIVRKMEIVNTGEQGCSVITREAVIDEQNASNETIEHGFDDFSSMIGMDTVEMRLREVVNQIHYARSTGMGKKPCMHMFFVGNPGTGKTTVARILGNELKKQNILRVGKFFEHNGRDLCGQYVGQTAPKTEAICHQAYGSILFIDEAYSLASDNSSNDYGKEAISTLITEMENHYDDLVVIFAGYPEEMEQLLALNPGMRSRVPYTIEFPNYSREDLYLIFSKISSAHFPHAPGFDEEARRFFLRISQQLLESKSFGNARFVRNLYERVWGKATARCARNGTSNIELTVEDFEDAISEFSKL